MKTRVLPGSSDLDLIVSAVPVPILVADYTPIIERFAGMSGVEVEKHLRSDRGLLVECLTLPIPIASSAEWDRLYGSPLTETTPDLAERHFTAERYPDLFETMVSQFSAPFFKTTSIVREHTAPTVIGDVIVRSHWRPLMDSEGPRWDRIVIADLDVSDLRTTQRHLEDALATMEELVESKDQLIASVSHEIRTPLSSIVGFARVLYESTELPDAERRELLGLVVQQSADLTNIVDDLLVAAKMDMGQLVVAQVSVDLRAQASQALEGLDTESRAKVSLPNESAHCIADPSRVRQIVRNLVSNALRYGGPEIVIGIREDERRGILSVTDNGEGIPEADRERIFEPYERSVGDPSIAPSMGLGLHISRTLADLMGGDLTYEYEDGHSVFRLSLVLMDDSTG